MKSDVEVNASAKKSNSASSNSNNMRRRSSLKHLSNSKVFFGENNPDIGQNSGLPDNTITTTKYNIFTFLPKSLLFQFKRAANIYFLIVSILTCMSFSPKQPSSMIGTFAFVLFATMVKEAFEDYGRYKQDSQSNNKKVFKYDQGHWVQVKCKSLRPGNLIKISKEEEFSADTLIIKSSNITGYCYIDTKNLDGETNLKEKCALEEFKDVSDRQYDSVQGSIDCEKPNENISSWEGVVVYQGNQIYSSFKNLILKGCSLKNTEHVIGIVVYSGHNTKIMKNSKRPRQKVSNVLIIMNFLLYSLFILDIIVCILFACLSFNFVSTNGPNFSYIYPDYNPDDVLNYPILRFGYSFLIFFIAYSQIIPISLYVALEMVKMIQGILIFYDADLYDLDLKKPAASRTTDLIEELGQVEFIFSDKTGTLTQNIMILKKCFINNKIYGANQQEKEDAKFTINGDNAAAQKMLSVNPEDKKDKQKLEDFFYLLALCHSVFPEKTDKGIIYQGSSPDDIALVKGAQQMGIEFAEKDFSDMKVINNLTKQTSVYEIKCEMPFDSDRKRMSVVVQDQLTKRLMLLSKGADNVMLGLKGKAIVTKFNNDKELENINELLNSFSKEGLRILVMGQKFLDEKVYAEWEKRLVDQRNKGKSLTELYSELECDLQFVGCSAIEDKLQEGVADTISNLLKCGIRIWVLTGDKQDTALEIAKSCKLIDESMHVVDLSSELDRIEERLQEVGDQLGVENFEDANNKIDLDKVNEIVKEMTDQDISLIIDGATLEVVLGDPQLSRFFFLISVAAKSVVCCRVSPKQKAKVVQLTRQNGRWVTLSIGDGANDVPMIMEANIGVGIQGKEGTQAVRASDYAISQFRFLEKLILVYGRNGYVKITKFICYYFYKNILLVFTELMFAFFDGFSGQIYFADYLGTMYNAFFTSWPCLFTFTLEREHDLNICKKFPTLYKAGPINYYFNFKVFWKYILYAIIHSTLTFYIPAVGLFDQVGSDGFTYNHWRVSTVSFSCVIHIVTFKLMLDTEFWNILNMFGAVVSIAFYYLCLVLLSSEYLSKSFQPELTGVAADILTNFKSLLVTFFTPLICILPDIIYKQISYNVYPSPTHVLKKFKNTPEVKRVLLTESVDLKRKNSSMPVFDQLQKNDNNENFSEQKKIANERKTKNGITSNQLLNLNNSDNSRVLLKESGEKDLTHFLKDFDVKESNKNLSIGNNKPMTEDNLKENNKESESPISIKKKLNKTSANPDRKKNDTLTTQLKHVPTFKSQTMIDLYNENSTPRNNNYLDPNCLQPNEDKDKVHHSKRKKEKGSSKGGHL